MEVVETIIPQRPFPPPPKAAFQFFAAAVKDPNWTVLQYLDAWEKLPGEEKARWNAQAEKDSQRYQDEYSKWLHRDGGAAWDSQMRTVTDPGVLPARVVGTEMRKFPVLHFSPDAVRVMSTATEVFIGMLARETLVHRRQPLVDEENLPSSGGADHEQEVHLEGAGGDAPFDLLALENAIHSFKTADNSEKAPEALGEVHTNGIEELKPSDAATTTNTPSKIQSKSPTVAMNDQLLAKRLKLLDIHRVIHSNDDLFGFLADSFAHPSTMAPPPSEKQIAEKPTFPKTEAKKGTPENKKKSKASARGVAPVETISANPMEPTRSSGSKPDKPVPALKPYDPKKMIHRPKLNFLNVIKYHASKNPGGPSWEEEPDKQKYQDELQAAKKQHAIDHEKWQIEYPLEFEELKKKREDQNERSKRRKQTTNDESTPSSSKTKKGKNSSKESVTSSSAHPLHEDEDDNPSDHDNEETPPFAAIDNLDQMPIQTQFRGNNEYRPLSQVIPNAGGEYRPLNHEYRPLNQVIVESRAQPPHEYMSSHHNQAPSDYRSFNPQQQQQQDYRPFNPSMMHHPARSMAANEYRPQMNQGMDPFAQLGSSIHSPMRGSFDNPMGRSPFMDPNRYAAGAGSVSGGSPFVPQQRNLGSTYQPIATQQQMYAHQQQQRPSLQQPSRQPGGPQTIEDPTLPHPWRKVVYGEDVYYWNVVTHNVSWKRPR